MLLILKKITDIIIVIAFSWQYCKKIWDAVSGDIKNTLQGHSSNVISVAISLDGSTIISGSGEYHNSNTPTTSAVSFPFHNFG